MREEAEKQGVGQKSPQKWKINISDADEGFVCIESKSVLDAMIGAGRASIRAGCRNGGCGICRVRVGKGNYASGKMTRSRISESDEAAGIVLACRIYPRSDLAIEPLPLGTKAILA